MYRAACVYICRCVCARAHACGHACKNSWKCISVSSGKVFEIREWSKTTHLTVESEEPVTMTRSSYWRQRTEPVCPVSTFKHSRLVLSQIYWGKITIRGISADTLQQSSRAPCTLNHRECTQGVGQDEYQTDRKEQEETEPGQYQLASRIDTKLCLRWTFSYCTHSISGFIKGIFFLNKIWEESAHSLVNNVTASTKIISKWIPLIASKLFFLNGVSVPWKPQRNYQEFLIRKYNISLQS